MRYPLDKLGRDYDQLLTLQAEHLEQWRRLLLPQVHAELVEYCRGINRSVSRSDVEAFASLRVYKAGALHLCPIGFEIPSILLNRSAFEEANAQMLRSTAAVVNAEVTRNRNHTMSNINKQFLIIASAFAALAEEFAHGAPSAGAADPKASLEAIASKKDPKLVKKILSKFGAESVTELEDGEVAKATEKIEALDDVSGGDADGGKVTLDTLKALAQELITDGKADAIKKILKKHGAEKVSLLAEKEFTAVHEKFTALKD